MMQIRFGSGPHRAERMLRGTSTRSWAITTGWDNSLFKESFGYTVLMFIQSITVQFNGNVDNVLVGALQGASFVTVYSMALTIFGMYENLSGSVANIMLPRVTKQVVAGNSNSQL